MGDITRDELAKRSRRDLVDLALGNAGHIRLLQHEWAQSEKRLAELRQKATDALATAAGTRLRGVAVSDVIPDEVMAKAKAIYDEADDFNRFTWHGPFRDELREFAVVIWNEAYQRGLEDGGA